MSPERILELDSWKKENTGILPHITLKWSQSLDGQLADDDDCSQWISGPEERQYTHWLRSVHDAVLVGAQTFLKDRCLLTVRGIPFAGKQPARVIADPRGRIYEELARNPQFFSSDPSLGTRRTYVLVPEVNNIAGQNSSDVVFVECGPANSLEDWLKKSLEKLSVEFRLREVRPLLALMVEGGSGILTALLRANLADTVEIAVSPLLLGGTKHRIAPNLRLSQNRRFLRLPTQSLGQDTLLRFQIPKNLEGATHAS